MPAILPGRSRKSHRGSLPAAGRGRLDSRRISERPAQFFSCSSATYHDACPRASGCYGDSLASIT
jgi:hypothetical protein